MSLIGRLVGVVWRDAFQDAKAQMNLEQIALAKSFIYTSYGILVRDDRGLAIKDPLIGISHEVGEDGSFRGVTFVPLEMLVEIQDLGSGRPRRRRSSQDPSSRTRRGHKRAKPPQLDGDSLSQDLGPLPSSTE